MCPEHSFKQPNADVSLSASRVPDTVLYARLRLGDVAALGTLYDRHAGLVYGIGLKLLNNRQAAEDLTQDIFVILANTDKYNPRKGALRTYLAVLTRSRAMDRLRSQGVAARGVHRLQRLQSTGGSANSPLDKASQTEQHLTLDVAIKRLPEEEQQILNLMYFEGLSQADIAGILEMPLGTVKTKSRRGLIKLRRMLTVTT